MPTAKLDHLDQRHHVQESEQGHEDRQHDEGDDVVHVAVARPTGELNHAAPDAHVGPGLLGQAELVHDEIERHAWDGTVLNEALHVQAEGHAGQEHAERKESDPGDQKSGGEAVRAPRAQVLQHARELWPVLRPLGLVALVVLPQRGWQPHSQRGDGRAHAEEGEASEPDAKLHRPIQHRRVAQAANEERHEDVGKHVGAGPLGDHLDDRNAPSCVGDARGAAAVPPQLSDRKHENLENRDDNGEEDHEGAANPTTSLGEHVYEADGGLIGLQSHRAVHGGDVELEQPHDEAGYEQGVAGDKQPEDPASAASRAALRPPPRIQDGTQGRHAAQSSHKHEGDSADSPHRPALLHRRTRCRRHHAGTACWQG
mmetsp:Transcript_92520/g.293410  ORF Transcript_92520/g.293410 Transcript_92520/m.293410 type:complete len:370 (-) Transcript_92520:85-1194(-)